jgi:diguanylate cyclase (GGDEF)-like protein
LDAPAPGRGDLDGRLASYQTLIDISRMLLGSATLAELFDRMASELKRLVPFDGVTVYRLDPVAEVLMPMHAVDDYADEIMAAPIDVSQGVTGWVIRHRTAQNLPRADLDPRINVVPGTENEPEALASVPLIVRDMPIGALNVYRLGEFVSFDEDEFDLICRFADLAALALDNTQNRERLVKEAQSDWLTGLHNHRYFHERLRDEIERAHRYRRPLSLITFDLDDFKLLNDVHGHQEGDLVLRRVAAAARDELRASDFACRVGGEEFAIVLPETSKRAARAAAARLCARVRALPAARPITVSCGVSAFPSDAKNARELLSAADAALYAAKEAGKDRAASYTRDVRRERGSQVGRGSDGEWFTQMKLLTALSTQLNRQNDVREIGATIVAELRAMIDYHNARVYLVAEDGDTIEPIAFGGVLSAYEGESFAVLRTRMGVGVTGHAARSGRTINVPDAGNHPLAVHVKGTVAIDESLIAVPVRHDGRTTGVIVLSKLGLNQFSPASVRLLETLATHAAVAFANAQEYQRQREEGRVATTLLHLARAASCNPSVAAVAAAVLATVCDLASADAAVLLLRDAGGRQRPLVSHGSPSLRSVAVAVARAGLAEGVTVVETGELTALRAGLEAEYPRVAVAPLHTGTLVVAGGPLGAPELRILQSVCESAASALRNAELLARAGAIAPSPLSQSGDV